MPAEKLIDVLSKGIVLHPETDHEVAAALAEHSYFLNSWLDSRLKYLAITLDIAQEAAAETNNAECRQLIATVRQELRLTEKLVVPVAAFTNEQGGFSLPPVQMAGVLAQTRADWVDFVQAATT